MDIFGICILAVTGCIIALNLKGTVPEYALAVTLVSGTIILISVCTPIPHIIEEINRLTVLSGVKEEYTKILFKAVGICFISQISSDICRDAGEGALAGKIELAGKVMIIVLALPLMEEILETAKLLLGG